MSSTTSKTDIAAPAGEFCSFAEEAVRKGAPEDRPAELAPFGEQPVNATEAVTAICAIMRAANLNFFDLQMWYRRAPNE
jgi:hypothetical protein